MSPLFAGTVEHTLEDCISTVDCKSAENILFYLNGTSQNKQTVFVQKLLETVDQNRWVQDGLF